MDGGTGLRFVLTHPSAVKLTPAQLSFVEKPNDAPEMDSTRVSSTTRGAPGFDFETRDSMNSRFRIGWGRSPELS